MSKQSLEMRAVSAQDQAHAMIDSRAQELDALLSRGLVVTQRDNDLAMIAIASVLGDRSMRKAAPAAAEDRDQ